MPNVFISTATLIWWPLTHAGLRRKKNKHILAKCFY